MVGKLVNILRFIANHPLNKNRRLRALAGFVKWQLGTRLIGGRLVVDWVDNAKFITQRREYGLTGNLYCGLTEYENMAFLLHFLRESDEFYDIGANVGAHTILASAVKSCRSFAFEPVPETFERLIDQIKINRIEELVHAENKGVGAEAGVLEFTNNLNCMNHVNMDPGNDQVTKVEVIKLDEQFDPTSISLVKIDVEGYEKFVFDGAEKFFSNPNVKAVIVEINGAGIQFGVSNSEIDKRIRAFGFRPVRYDPMSRELLGLDKIEFGENIIYVKDILGASERCKSSEKFVLHTANDIII